MPFTTSHPAIIIPLKKLWPKHFSLTGLMAGTMAPDLLYFLILTTVSRGFSHSWSGLIYFCIPAGILFSFAFHRLFKTVFFQYLPSPMDKYFSGLAAVRWKPEGVKGWIILVISVTIGTLSHFFWDSFTHIHGALIVELPFLAEKAMLFGHWIYYATIAQHLSTILGTLTIIIFVLKGNIIPPSVSDYKSKSFRNKIKFWVGGISLSLIFAFTVVKTFNYCIPNHPVGNYQIFGLSSWAGFFWYVVILNLIGRLKNRKEVSSNGTL